jgi:hypothetical protein
MFEKKSVEHAQLKSEKSTALVQVAEASTVVQGSSEQGMKVSQFVPV